MRRSYLSSLGFVWPEQGTVAHAPSIASITLPMCAGFTFPIDELPTLAQPERASRDATARMRHIAWACGRPLADVEGEIFYMLRAAAIVAMGLAVKVLRMAALRWVSPNEEALFYNPGLMPIEHAVEEYGKAKAAADAIRGVEWPDDEPEVAA